MKHPLILAATIALILSSVQTGAMAYGEAHYNEAIQAYQNGELERARVHFYAYIKSHPRVYQAHYQLANTLTQKCDFDTAITEYQKTLQLNPDKLTAERSREAIKQLAYLRLLPPTQKPISKEERQAKLLEENQAKTYAMQAEQQRRVQAQKDQITADAERTANNILNDAQSQVQAAASTSNYRCRNYNGEYIGVALPTRIERDIMGPAEAEAARIRAEAQRRAATVESRNYIGNTPGRLAQ